VLLHFDILLSLCLAALVVCLDILWCLEWLILPAWIVFANCLSFFVYVYVFDGWAHSQFEGSSLTHGRTANLKHAAGLTSQSKLKQQSCESGPSRRSPGHLGHAA
jgi:hypothetical protein